MIFQHPFTATIAGPTQSGKSTFVFKLIDNVKTLISPPPQKIVYCYSIHQDIFNKYKHVQFQQGLPDVDQFDGKQRVLLILDDLMAECNNAVSNIFTRGSHHLNISVIYLTQNLFFGSKHNRTMSLNTHYLILFKNPRDVGQITYLSRQMQVPHLVDAFRDATKTNFGYLVVDLKPSTDDDVRLRTGIFPGQTEYAYINSASKAI